MQSITRYKLINKHNMHVELCDFGARILSIKFPDITGKLVETTLNHSSDEDIFNDDSYMGTTVGRVCNRISNAKFSLDGTEYSLTPNEGKNTLHGGVNGFDKIYWKTHGVVKDNKICFELLSPDGDEGFPGDLSVLLTYELTDTNELVISYKANSTKPTPINLCNHAYFNLGEQTIHDMSLQLFCEEYLPVDEESIPLGHFQTVQGSKFDLRASTDLAGIDQTGFDHCYKVTQSNTAKVWAKNTRICLEIETDQSGIQLYTGNFLPKKQSALCLEAQGFNDAINHDKIPADILRPNNEYKRRVIYRYSHF